MFYGNMSLQLINEFEKLKLKFDNTNYDKNINLEYNEPSIYDIIKLNNYCNQYDDETRINIAEEYDNPKDIFINHYILNNQNTIVNQLDKYLDYIQDICNYYVLKYKIKFNAPRPFQLAHKFKVDLYPVGLNTVPTWAKPRKVLSLRFPTVFRLLSSPNHPATIAELFHIPNLSVRVKREFASNRQWRNRQDS